MEPPRLAPWEDGLPPAPREGSLGAAQSVAPMEYTERRGAMRSRMVGKDGAPSSSSCLKRSAAAAYEEGRENAGAGARVRARRGEATDKHSISERTRRTKITERTRSLHRLVPHASKTIRASMLEEAIQYVSMLQARLKMECSGKLDACGEAFSTTCSNASGDISEGWRKSCNRVFVNKMIERVLDPQEEKLAEVERQVMSRLSHPSADHSHVSTYLASLGLALLPISHLPSPPLNTNVSRL